MRLLIACLLLYSVSSAEAQEAVHPDSAEILAKIEKAWKEREAKVKSFDATWKMETIYVKGSLGVNRLNEPIPPNDTPHISGLRFVGKNKKLMWRRVGPDYFMDAQGFIAKDITLAFDGNERREIRTLENLPLAGFLYSSGHFDDNDWRLYPLQFNLRPFSGNSPSTPLGNLSDAVVLPSESEAYIIQWANRTGRIINRIRVNSNQLLIGSWELISRGITRYSLNIEYSVDEPSLSYPVKWTCIKKDDRGNLTESSVSYDVMVALNIPLEDELFHPEFAHGTLVTHLPEETYSLADENGNLRPTLLEELGVSGKTRKELAEDAPIMEAVAVINKNRWFTGYNLAWGFVLGLVVCVLFYRFVLIRR